MIVHVLASGMADQNPRGFLFPILHGEHRLREAGVVVRRVCFGQPDVAECDALLVDSKAFDSAVPPAERSAQLLRWRETCAVGYFDLTDSATQLRPELIGGPTLYFKNQLARDRAVFRRPLYGHRLYTDYYHRTEAVNDETPATSPALSDDQIDRLRVGWNAGLSNYALYGPRLATLYDRVPLRPLLFYPRRFHAADAARPVAVSCRMSTSYARRTVAHQRLRTKAILERYAPATRVSKRAYARELRQARLTISPFGWGEINQKDFECFLAGTAVVKPDVAWLETWPNWFKADETYVPYRWDFSDLLEVVERFLRQDCERRGIAAAAQDLYRFHVATSAGAEAFCERFLAIIADLRRQRGADAGRPNRGA